MSDVEDPLRSMEPPEWFTTALACLPEERIVDGIHVLHWRGQCPPSGPGLGQSPPRPTIVLLHGSGANCHWYSFVAPLLLDAYDVVAISNSGNGRSKWCDAYSPRSWADEVVMVLERLHLTPRRGSTAATTTATTTARIACSGHVCSVTRLSIGNAIIRSSYNYDCVTNTLI